MDYPVYEQPLRENSMRARIVTWIFRIQLILSSTNLLFVIGLIATRDSDTLVGGEPIRPLIGLLLLVFSGISTLVLIVGIVFFIMWMRRAYYNLHSIGTTGLRHSEGWAAGAWFVPILNWIWPYEIMKDIWHATQQMAYLRLNQPTGYIHEPGKLVGWWWGFFVTKNLLGYFVNMMQPDSTGTLMALAMLVMPAELFALKISIDLVKKVSTFEKTLYDSYTPLSSTDKYVIASDSH